MQLLGGLVGELAKHSCLQVGISFNSWWVQKDVRNFLDDIRVDSSDDQVVFTFALVNAAYVGRRIHIMETDPGVLLGVSWNLITIAGEQMQADTLEHKRK